MKKLLIASALVLASFAAAAADCSPDKFVITSKSPRIEKGAILVMTVQVRNDNPVACGVQVTVETGAADGTVVGSQQAWLAGVQDIPAGQTYSADVYVPKGAAPVAKTRVQVIRAKHWGQQ